MEEEKGQVHYHQNGMVVLGQVLPAEHKTFLQKEALPVAEEYPRKWYQGNQSEPIPEDSHPPSPAAGRLVHLRQEARHRIRSAVRFHKKVRQPREGQQVPGLIMTIRTGHILQATAIQG